MTQLTTGGQTVPPWVFWAGSVAVIVIIGTIIWFAIPDINARHHFVSPSGKIALDVAENCSEEQGCQRVVVKEMTLSDGMKSRLGCPVPITEPRPMLVNAYPLWSADERSVEIVYMDGDGVGGKFVLDLERDCTLTQ